MSMNSGRMMYMSKFCLSAKKGSGATVVVVVQSSHLPSRIKSCEGYSELRLQLRLRLGLGSKRWTVMARVRVR